MYSARRSTAQVSCDLSSASTFTLLTRLPSATRDSTAHGGVIVGGCPTVLIGG